MILSSAIKNLIYSLCLVLTLSLNAQINDIQNQRIEHQDAEANSKQRYIAYSIGYHNPIASGTNFIGKALEGNGGFDFKIQMYIYKQFFIGGSLGASYFSVKNPLIVGEYKRTRISEQFAYLGYEFVPSPDFRIGLTTSIIGTSGYKNEKSNNAYQKDTAKLRSYGCYVSYEISRQFMFYIDYAYRVDKTNINVPTSLEDTFRKGTFHQVGLGIKFSFIGKDFTSLF